MEKKKMKNVVDVADVDVADVDMVVVAFPIFSRYVSVKKLGTKKLGLDSNQRLKTDWCSLPSSFVGCWTIHLHLSSTLSLSLSLSRTHTYTLSLSHTNTLSLSLVNARGSQMRVEGNKRSRPPHPPPHDEFIVLVVSRTKLKQSPSQSWKKWVE